MRIYGNNDAVSVRPFPFGWSHRCRGCGSECLCEDVHLCGTHLHGIGFQVTNVCLGCFKKSPEYERDRSKMEVSTVGGEAAKEWAANVSGVTVDSNAPDKFYEEPNPGLADWVNERLRVALETIRSKGKTLPCRRLLCSTGLSTYDVVLPLLSKFDQTWCSSEKNGYTPSTRDFPVEVLYWDLDLVVATEVVAPRNIKKAGDALDSRLDAMVAAQYNRPRVTLLLTKTEVIDGLVREGMLGDKTT